ncbi:hypothetical protein PMYN1_Chma594 (chromatophore) [Paulinella micropora]|uniref:Uncharacterized protein n=1 Tax=Paulinella micropora TaxID=1928728 RepID=A0A1L5YCH9_9EUKA|nr:hypothetical protein PCKR_647 [Paulinella micropora]AQX45182.1 hypothetical protein PFK_647 [Paulinella micropora]BBL86399.1 hypothetical protein PMYN1_Chma594 [Paulinella micropora]
MQSIKLSLAWKRVIVAVLPLSGALIFPMLVLFLITRGGMNTGIGTALLVSTLWFVIMLITSEMPHSENSSH